MALEELIIAWSNDRPAWQREVMRRVATGDMFSAKDFDQLVEEIVTGKQLPDVIFGLEQFPHTTPGDLPVRLVSIQKPEHVNALESINPLTCSPDGLTIIYGDNASGKSGYARLLKRIARARHQEEVLSDVFRDTSIAKPTAVIIARIGEDDLQINWPETSQHELQRMLFYDAACGNAYIVTESEFPYRPSALYVMDGLIEACINVRERIDEILLENGKRATIMPAVPEDVSDTEAGKFLSELSAMSTVEMLDVLIKRYDESKETIEDLKDREAKLRSADTTKERQNLLRQSEKLNDIDTHLQQTHTVLANENLSEIQMQRAKLKVLEESSTLLAQPFDSEPLSGVGTAAWKELWETARRFSESHAYYGQTFPQIADDCRCVLCQQTLQPDARERLLRFERFVKDDTQIRLKEAQKIYNQKIKQLETHIPMPATVDNHLKDLETTHKNIVTEIRALLTEYSLAKEQALTAHNSGVELPQLQIENGTVMANLTESINAAKNAAENLTKPEVLQKQLAGLSARRMELELLQEIKKQRDAIVNEIKRLKERQILESAKSAAATGPITKKILELSEESITEIVRDTFTRETDRLRLERVTIARTRAEKGALLHQPKLVGTRQQVILPRVFSEGERSALGLAAFFTEAALDTSNSAIILDDPVTSLDHVRRGLVAGRIAEFGRTRQVVILSHDVAFVADLKREAKERGISVTERSVTRSHTGERKPGTCIAMHPWKAKDVPERLDELRSELARIKKEYSACDQQTYDDAVANWAGKLSESWERIFSQEIVGPILAEGGLEVRPSMVKILVHFKEADYNEFEASYSRISQWARRHDKSVMINYVAPDVNDLEAELEKVAIWHKRVKRYKS